MTTIEAGSKFYIETSKGRVEIFFEKEAVLNPSPARYPIFRKWRIEEIKEIAKIDKKILEELYDLASLSIRNTDNGLFLEIELDDGHYGSPEYKLFSS